MVATAAALVASFAGASATECSVPCAGDADCSEVAITGAPSYCSDTGVCVAAEPAKCSDVDVDGTTETNAYTWTQFKPADHAFTCHGCFSSCPDVGNDWQAVPYTTLLEETGADTAVLRGTLQNQGSAASQITIVARLSGKIFVPAGASGHPSGSPKGPRAGGASANDYTYYTSADVHFVGVAGTPMEGLDVSMSRKGPAFQLAVGGNDKDADLGASMWLMSSGAPVTQPTGSSCSFSFGSTIDLNLDLSQVCLLGKPCDEPPVLPPPEHQCEAFRAIPSPDTCTRPGGHALTLSGIGSLTFADGSGRWSIFADGTAAITGVVQVPMNGQTARFDAYYVVGGRTQEPDLCTGPGTEPETGSFCSPKKELWNSNSDKTVGGCYAPSGAIDVTQWTMYLHVVEGTLYGRAGEATEGYKIDLKMRGPSLQFGQGAGGKNGVNQGVSGWVSHRIASTGSGLAKLDGLNDGKWRNGDWNIDVRCDEPLVPCTGKCELYTVECGCESPRVESDDKCVCLDFVDAADPDSLDCDPKRVPCF